VRAIVSGGNVDNGYAISDARQGKGDA